MTGHILSRGGHGRTAALRSGTVVIALAIAFVAGPFFAIPSASASATAPVSPIASQPHRFPSSIPSVSDGVNPHLFYSKEPAPMGVADFGLGANGTPYQYQTSGFLGVMNINSLSAYNSSLPSSYNHDMTIQLNVVLEFTDAGSTFVYWIQDVAIINTLTGNFSFEDNVWNFSSPQASMYASTISGNGTLLAYGSLQFYYASATTQPGNNITIPLPQVVQLSVSSSMTASGPDVSFLYYDGYGWQSYDTVHFIFAPNASFDNGFVVNGNSYNPAGLYYDAELTLGGPGGGAGTNASGSQLQMQLEYWNGNNYQFTPAAYNYGSNTGETVGGVVSSESMNHTSSLMVTDIGSGSGTLEQLYNQSSVATLNIKAVFSFEGSVSGDLYLNSTGYAFINGDVKLTVPAGDYVIELFSTSGIFYWRNFSVNLTRGKTVSMSSGYMLTFSESGLPSSTVWSIEMTNSTGAGLRSSSASPSISLVVTYGSYSYQVGVVTGYSPTLYSDNGYITRNVSRTVTFLKWPSTMISTGAGSEPQFAVYDPADGYVYVANANATSIMVVSGNNVIQNIGLGSGNYPSSMLLDPVNGKVYVQATDGLGSISPFSTTFTTVLPGYFFEAMAYDSSNTYIYAAGNSNITEINPGNGQIASTFALSIQPFGIAYDVQDGYLYLLNYNSGPGGSITVVNPGSGGILATLNMSQVPMGVMYDNVSGEIYVSSYSNGGVQSGWSSDTTSGIVTAVSGTTIVGSVAVGNLPSFMTFNPSSGVIYVANEYSDNVSILISTSIAVEGSITAGYVPTGLAYDISTGYLYIANAASGDIANVSVAQMYSVQFTETGLPSGTEWFLNLSNGQSFSSTNSSISINEMNGSYSYSVSTTNDLWHAPGSTFYVTGSPLGIHVVFTEVTYQVVVGESGLPSGTTWYVNLSSGQSFHGTSSTIYFNETNGTYTFTPGSINSSYAAPGGTFTISGAGVTITVAFHPEFYTVTYSETGLPSGSTWSVTLGGSTITSTSGSISFLETNGTYLFTAGTSNGYYPSPSSGSITVSGANVSMSVRYSEHGFTVTFNETGLPTGTTWYVNLSSGQSFHGTSSTIYFNETNGTFIYTIGTADNEYSSPGGSLTVNGTPVLMSVTFTQVIYQVTVTETGLPTGTTWYVNLSSGQSFHGTSSTIYFNETNGTYDFTIGTTDRSYAAPVGSLTVSGSETSVSVAFSPVYYTVTFTESGLTSGTTWDVALGSMAVTSSGGTITFYEPNGSYSFTAGSYIGYYASPFSGNITVDGRSVSLPVKFNEAMFVVTFTETGLPSGTTWFVNLSNGVSYTGSSSSITLIEANGSYSYAVSTPGGLWASRALSFSINGSGVSVRVAFSPVTYHVTIAESGLPQGTTWYVTFNGRTIQYSSSSALFSLQNGTYTFTISRAQGYTLSESTVNVTVSGSGVTESVRFLSTSGTLLLNVSPSGANVTVNGSTVHVTGGMLNITLAPGAYEVAVSSPGYAMKYMNITITAGNTTAGTVSLQKMQNPGYSSTLVNYLFYVAAVVLVAAVVGLMAVRRRRNN